jgi:hypothetical protein
MLLGVTLLLAVAGAPPPALTIAGDAFWVHERADTPRLGDRVIVNFEGGICAEQKHGGRKDPATGRWRLCQSPRAPTWLKAAGVDGVVLENNHASDGDAARLPGALSAARVRPILMTRPFCQQETCLYAWVDSRDDFKVFLNRVRARAHAGKRVVAIVHRAGKRGVRQLDEVAKAGAAIVIGIGGHEAGRVRRAGDAWVLEDLGDLVVDCACSQGRRGMVVDVPVDASEPLVVRLVRAAHAPGDVVGAPVEPAEAERVLGALSAGQPGARVVDGRLELESPRPTAGSELERLEGQALP